ncbi:hypothetical protein BDZ94DRAFT_862770 [Collybia nuda]|uniref:SH3 domain-containing protein n=1 Tax=Collybia nuda TaxID=64659 RepID=A0A9P5Y442_9AGAR|nr:hypothetical protein BDZ94DRAFT_862770 [Collybia nuda]
MQAIDTRRVVLQDTFDLREQIHQDDHIHLHAHADAASANYADDEEHSVLEDDSDGEDHDEYMDDDDDGSSSLSIPNESIDFDLVYSLHSFAATVEGQANVVKGDSLFLMDDNNSYWWLVRVLKTQEVGYIPAENIETPFERLARLNKHRNVDLASATQAELNENLHASQDRLRNTINSRAGSNQTPSPNPQTNDTRPRTVLFTPSLSVHRYPPAIWKEDEIDDPDTEWDDEPYEGEDVGLADEQMEQMRAEDGGPGGMEPDDGMTWEDSAVENMRAAAAPAAPQGQGVPAALQVGGIRDQQQQREGFSQQQQQQQQQQQNPNPEQQQHVLRSSESRERLQDPARSIDPATVTETRKVTVTPTIARGGEEDLTNGKPYLPSANLERQREEERVKRMREEELLEEAKKKAKPRDKMAAPISSANLNKQNAGTKLRKGQHRDSDDDSTKDEKKKGIFKNLFRKKDKKDKNASIGSLDSGDIMGRTSEESSRSGHRPSGVDGMVSPTTATALQQQQQQSLGARISADSRRAAQSQPQPETPERAPPVSQHTSQLRQRDQQQQALYHQQYLTRSPSSPPEVEPSYGLQSARSIMPSSYHSPSGSGGSTTGLGPPTTRPRPGSLILTQSIMDGQGPGVPELSVIRVFAGKNLQTEATFKTVLLNSSTTSTDLIRQAIQRFRLSSGEDESEYYLTVKQVEGGSSAVLLPAEKPLGVFETLVVEAMELPKVKRSSVGSISSVSSNLSMHPAIKKLPMNDFTDDSAVKFYLNRKGDDIDDSVVGHGDEADETLIADSSFGDSIDVHSPIRSQYLSVSTNHNVTPERFSSPSFRFALQLVIYPDDLPDDMVFHPLTEAIVFKDTLRDADAAMAPTVSPTLRRKVFVVPKNITVAEVIETGLERFGISEGVVDGGDEVEDKLAKRRSSTRVRYGLIVDTGTHERELAPSSRVIDAFPRPPTYRAAERPTPNSKRRSVDSTQILGTLDDVNPDDPVFILRRAVTYRNSTYRHRTSAPLDEIALQQLHRESASSIGSDPATPSHDTEHKQPSRQEIIARQREATRANQRAILSAQTNSVRGMDVLLPGNAMLRSSRYDSNDRMRYSYVEPDGETYDISDIVEEELRESNSANRNDLLEGVLGRKDAVGDKLERVLSKIRSGKSKERDLLSLESGTSSHRSNSPSEYSLDERVGDTTLRSGSRSASPRTTNFTDPMQRAQSAASSNAHDKSSRPGTTTPTGKPAPPPGTSRRHPSIASVMSDLSGYDTAPTQLAISPTEDSPRSVATPKPQRRRLIIPKDDFGISHMMAIIESKALRPKDPLPPLSVAEELLFGRPIDLQALHPQVRDIYANSFRQLAEMDKILDDYLEQTLAGR